MSSRIRERSGKVNSKDPLVLFLYLLLRDHITSGSLEEIVKDMTGSQGTQVYFSNGWLAKYAEDIAVRLRKSKV